MSPISMAIEVGANVPQCNLVDLSKNTPISLSKTGNVVYVNFGIDFYERKNNYGFNGGSGTSVDNFTFSMYTAKINFKF